MKILLSAVGNRDPFALDNTDGPLLTVAKHIEPDILIMFPTQNQLDESRSSTEDRCPEIETEIKGYLPEITIRRVPIDLPDPTDYHDVLAKLIKKIEEIKKKYESSKAEYYINVSSATAQIQASFLILVSTQRISAKVYQARDPKYVMEGQERVKEIDIQFLEEENQIRRARIFSKKYYFSSAADELISLAVNTRKAERAKLAELFSDILTAYHYMDLYQHQEGLCHLERAIPEISRYRLDSMLPILHSQEKCLKKIIELRDEESWENICELYHNIVRRFEMEQYIECSSRYKRIYEGCHFYIARHELNIKKPNGKIQEQRGLEDVYNIIGRREGYLNPYDIANIYLNKKGKPLIKENLQEQLNLLNKQRNSSINSHGMDSIKRDEAGKAVKLSKELLAQIFPEEETDKHPFSKTNLDTVVNILFEKLN